MRESSPGTSGSSRWNSVPDDVPTADHDRAHIGGAGAEGGRLQRQATGCARGPDAVQRDGDQVGPGPGRDLPGVRPAQAGVPGAGRGGEQGLRGEVAAGAAGQPFGILDPAGFLQHVDHRVAVAAQRQRAAGRGQRLRGREAVAQIALGRGAQAGEHAAAAEQVQVNGVDMGGVHDGGPRPERVLLVQQLGGRDAVERLARVVLGLLLRHVRVQRGTARAGPGHHRVHLIPGDRANGMDRRACLGVRGDHAMLVVPEVRGPRRPPRGVAVTEAQLRAGQRQHPARFSRGQAAG